MYINIYMYIYGNRVNTYAIMYIKYRHIYDIYNIYIYIYNIIYISHIHIHIWMHIYRSSSVISFQILWEVCGFSRSCDFCSLKFFAASIFVDLPFNIFKYLGPYQVPMMDSFFKIGFSFLQFSQVVPS